MKNPNSEIEIKLNIYLFVGILNNCIRNQSKDLNFPKILPFNI